VARYEVLVKEYNEAYVALRQEARAKEEEASSDERRRAIRQRYQQRLATARRRTQTARGRLARAQVALGKVKAQATIAAKKRTWNLGTSLKSYIDPRVYYRWGQQVDYDVLERYYPTVLRRKFAWVRTAAEEQAREGEHLKHLVVRTCMADDLQAVAVMFHRLNETYPEAEFPVDAEAIDAQYLPRLGEAWREAVVALGDANQVVAFVALGPAWMNGDAAAALDIFAAVLPEESSPALGRLLAREVGQRLDAYRLQSPKDEPALAPRDPGWVRYAPDLAAALGLLEPQDDDARDEG